MLNGKICLVTGAAGFVGSHLVDQLLKQNNQVFGLDNLSKGTLDNLQNALKKSQFRFINGSVENKELINFLVIDQKVDVVFHLASGNLLTSVQNPTQDINTTITGVVNILESIRHSSKKTILVHSSTGSVYGEPITSPQTEDHPLNPTSPYGVSKLAAEKYIELWEQLYNIKAVMLRYYNVYGPRQNVSDTGGVIPIFIKRIAENKPPIIEGTGEQERCFTFVSDVVKANILAAQTKLKQNNIFNIASDEITSIKKLAEIVLEKMNKKKLKPIFKERRLGDIDAFNPDISRAKKTLNYQPEVSFSQGLTKTIDWYLQNLQRH